MSDAPTASFFDRTRPRIAGRSMGLKLLLVCGLALLMTIPALFVFALLMDRTHRAEQVAQEIGGLMGGPQTFMGPVLAVPYTTPAPKAGEAPVANVWVVYPQTGAATVDTRTEVRRRSLFSVPVYQADVAFSAHFDLTELRHNAEVAGATLDWTRAEFLTGASDPRGARADVIVGVAGKRWALSPAAVAETVDLNSATGRQISDGVPRADGLKLFGLNATPFLSAGDAIDVTGEMKFTGARRVSVLAFAKTTAVKIRGDWNSPSFDGGFLPTHRQVAGGEEARGAGGLKRGFTADWAVPFIGRGVASLTSLDSLPRLGAADLGVSFVEPANPYQAVGRSLKYALLFVGLVFLAYFLFETSTGKRVHPAQYVLIGLAQVIFYLLLLALAERIGFDLGFLCAASATVGLISAYAGWVFESRAQGLRALAAFTFLYSLIYVLMRLEDYALLVGAVSSFAAIALVMYFTRRIDWYGANQPVSSPYPSESKESA